MIEAVALGLAALAGLAYLPLTGKPPGPWRSAIKTAPLVLFAAVAWGAGLPALLVAGFALSALGDLALSRDGDRAFLVGLCGFAAAHVCYALFFAGFAQGWPLLALLGLAALALSTEGWLAPHTGDLRWPVRVYVGLICAMGVAAFALPPALRLATWGAVAFMVSDVILAVQLFRMIPGSRAARRAGYVLWALYAGGQAMILLAFLPEAALS